MRPMFFLVGMLLTNLASVVIAGIPTSETIKCPVGGKSFKTTGTASCTTFGGSQDFLLKVQSSCDFVTRLPQCPDNGLPIYKDFSPIEIALLNEYAKSADFAAMAGRSRFHIAKKVDDFLVSKGSSPAFGFWYLLGGLQHDRDATIADAEYLGWFKTVGRADLVKASKEDAPIIRLLVAYAAYRTKDFATAASDLAAVKSDTSVKDDKFVQSYITRLSACIEAKDIELCPAGERVLPQTR
jgi:hypothetical protein